MSGTLILPDKHLEILYSDGWTIRELAVRYYVSPATIRRHLLQMGVLKTKPVQIKRSELLKHRKTKTIKQIALIYGVSEKTISRKLKGAKK